MANEDYWVAPNMQRSYLVAEKAYAYLCQAGFAEVCRRMADSGFTPDVAPTDLWVDTLDRDEVGICFLRRPQKQYDSLHRIQMPLGLVVEHFPSSGRTWEGARWELIELYVRMRKVVPLELCSAALWAWADHHKWKYKGRSQDMVWAAAVLYFYGDHGLAAVKKLY